MRVYITTAPGQLVVSATDPATALSASPRPKLVPAPSPWPLTTEKVRDL